MNQPTLADIGELGLLQLLQPFCRRDFLGDDAAVLPPSDESLVITTDLLVESVHFSDRTTMPFDVGWRAIAVNLSDLAAMGAKSIGVTIGLSSPGKLAVAWVEQVYQGMAACLQAHGGEILGGDVVRSDQTMLAITAIGQVHPQRIVRRDRAQPGQVIVATGVHGAARTGLELLLHPETESPLSEGDKQRFIQAHQRPIPRLDVVQLLAPFADDDFLHLAGMDSSDGLANAVLHLCKASGVGAKLWRSRLPLPPKLSAWRGESEAQAWCLYGGEDFELVLCLPPAMADQLLPQLGSEAAIVGTIEAGEAVWLVDDGEDAAAMQLTWESCFQHF